MYVCECVCGVEYTRVRACVRVCVCKRGPGATSVSNLDPTYHTLPKTKHTCELIAVGQVQADEWHALECLDVAWGNGVGEGRVRRNEEGSRKGYHKG